MLSPCLLPHPTDNLKMILSPAPVSSSTYLLIFGLCPTLTGFCIAQNFQFIHILFNEICTWTNKLTWKSFIYPKPINSPKRVYLSMVHLKRTHPRNCSLVQVVMHMKRSRNHDGQRWAFKTEVSSVMSLNA